MTEKIDLLSLYPEEIRAILTEAGEAPFRAGQIFRWLGRGAEHFSEMTDLSKAMREKLEEIFFIDRFREEDCIASRLDETRKYLFTLSDGE
ncbi:MAG: 23S rRNA (adenine(2503)-C(2))-methyltransferase RlmN, partial [Clostridia bacterium]|nr:23S rRNA (adenine(2503)-C(2))-methyltransferase RlmN [Clostridia bacterium]